jgi:predicted ATPase
MNRLTRLTLTGFKTFRELKGFDPQALNVLIGANGAGKSNFISFFRLMSWMMASTGNLQDHIGRQGGAHMLLHDGPDITREIEAEISIVTEKGTNDYAFRLAYAAGDTLIFTDERFRFSRNDISAPAQWRILGAGHRESQLISLADQGDPTARTVRTLLQRCVTYQFHNTSPTSRMRGKWPVTDNRYLKEDAGNLAPVLFRLSQEEPRSYRRIVDTLRLIIPFLDDFELIPSRDSLLLAWRETGSDVVFDASQASDGTLRTFALVTLLGQPEEDLPDVLLLDEPELGLHPYAIHILGGMIKRVSTCAQTIAATQSVTLIDQMAPEDIVVIERSGRSSTMRRLDPELLAEWLEEYSLGELWLKNILGGRPQR